MAFINTMQQVKWIEFNHEMNLKIECIKRYLIQKCGRSDHMVVYAERTDLLCAIETFIRSEM